jgi:hypothetical protein
MFATAHGTVRRNSMAAFTNIPSNGKIAMRFGTAPAEEAEAAGPLGFEVCLPASAVNQP